MTVHPDEKITEMTAVWCEVHGLSSRAHFGRCPFIVESKSYDVRRCGRPIRWVTVAMTGHLRQENTDV